MCFLTENGTSLSLFHTLCYKPNLFYNITSYGQGRFLNPGSYRTSVDAGGTLRVRVKHHCPKTAISKIK